MDENFFPFIGAPEDYINNTDNDLPLFKELAWDFKNDDYIIDENTGDFKILEGKKALEVWMYLGIKTSRFMHVIHSWDYGTELLELVGQKFTRGLTESEAFRYLKEFLETNKYILDIQNLGIDFREDRLYIHIKVNTVYGEIEVNNIV